MNIFQRFHFHVIRFFAKRLSFIRNNQRKKKLFNYDFSLISQNCIGGVISHDLGLRFLSPTVNLYMDSHDFMFFVENIKAFEEKRLTFLDTESPYPVGYLELDGHKITLNFVHYKTQDDAAQKWYSRYKRLNHEKLYVVMTDRDGFDDGIKERFLNLPYKKLLFTKNNYGISETVYCPKYKNEAQVGDLIAYVSPFGKRGYDQVDIVEWLNS